MAYYDVVEVGYNSRGGCRLICNILWMLLGGVPLALLWFISGVILCIPVVTIPFCVQCFKMGMFMLCPFGQRIYYDNDECCNVRHCCHLVGNILWFPFGLVLFLCHLAFGLLFCVTIIGIPFGVQHLKFARLALWPFGARFTPYRPGSRQRPKYGGSPTDSYHAHQEHSRSYESRGYGSHYHRANEGHHYAAGSDGESTIRSVEEESIGGASSAYGVPGMASIRPSAGSSIGVNGFYSATMADLLVSQSGPSANAADLSSEPQSGEALVSGSGGSPRSRAGSSSKGACAGTSSDASSKSSSKRGHTTAPSVISSVDAIAAQGGLE